MTLPAIDGATSKTYTTTLDDEFNFLKVEVTPAAAAGIITGEAVLSRPAAEIKTPIGAQ